MASYLVCSQITSLLLGARLAEVENNGWIHSTSFCEQISHLKWGGGGGGGGGGERERERERERETEVLNINSLSKYVYKIILT